MLNHAIFYMCHILYILVYVALSLSLYSRSQSGDLPTFRTAIADPFLACLAVD